LTAEIAVNAALSQFRNTNVEINLVTMARNETRLDDTFRSARETGGIIVYTFLSEKLHRYFLAKIADEKVPAVDLMGPLLTAFTAFLGIHPVGGPDTHRKLSESYFRGIEAIEYTVNHDDGQDPDGLKFADIVIVGVSRTSKTPLSIFLSNQNLLRVANIPIILDVGLPTQLFQLDKKRIIGLTIAPERLVEIRKERIKRAPFRAPPKYTKYNRIVKELQYSHHLFTTNGWTVIDVTEKSIEEAASEILLKLKMLQTRF
jgi:regulator of PEP synthase PpsR (kinase-PPPase family)